MANRLVYVDLKGARTAPGTLVRGGGTMATAQNVTIDAPGIIRKRGGFRKTATATTSTQIATQYVHAVSAGGWNDYVVAANEGDSAPDACVYADTVRLYRKDKTTDTSGAKVSVTSEPASNLPFQQYRKLRSNSTPTGKLKTATHKSEFLFTSGAGLQKFEAEGLATYRRPVGLPRILHGKVTHIEGGGGAGLNLLVGHAICYCAVLGFEKDDGARIYSSPSPPVFVHNATGVIAGYTAAAAAYATIKYQLPEALLTISEDVSALDSRYFIEIYRTASADVSSNVYPDSNFYKIHEAYLTAADFATAKAARQFEYSDSNPESALLRREPLYTNPLDGDGYGFGFLGANEPPENFSEVVEWNGTVFGANYNTRHYMTLTMLDAPSDTSTILVAGTTYTFKTTPAATTDVRVSPITTSLGDHHTMADLARAINETNDYVNAFVLSSPGGAGIDNAVAKLFLQHKLFPTYASANSFYVSFGDDATAQKFLPYDSETVSNRLNSSSDRETGVVNFCRPNNPNAWWPAGRIRIGDSNCEIKALSQLEEGVYVFTTNGLYLISGGNPGFQVNHVDQTAIIAGAECVTKCDGSIFAWMQLGIAEIKGGRVQYVSGPIQDQLDKLRDELVGVTVDLAGYQMETSDAFAFASADPNMGRVFFFFPDLDAFNVGTP